MTVEEQSYLFGRIKVPFSRTVVTRPVEIEPLGNYSKGSQFFATPQSPNEFSNSIDIDLVSGNFLTRKSELIKKLNSHEITDEKIRIRRSRRFHLWKSALNNRFVERRLIHTNRFKQNSSEKRYLSKLA